MPRWSDETEQLRVLEHRRLWLESVIETRGDTRGYLMREAAALAWLFECLEETSLADALTEARAIVARNPPRVKPNPGGDS